jgi:hypothetical protein
MRTLVFTRATFAPAGEPGVETITVAFTAEEEDAAPVAATARVIRTAHGAHRFFEHAPSEWAEDLDVADGIRDYAILADRKRAPGEDTVKLRVEVRVDPEAGQGDEAEPHG